MDELLKMRFSRPKKQYHVTSKWIDYRSGGGGRNYIATPSLARAIRANKKLKRRRRQIDVRPWKREPYVLHNSWL